MSQTLGLIKTHALPSTTPILMIGQDAGLRPLNVLSLYLTEDQIHDLYQDHVDKPYWSDLKASVTGLVTAIHWDHDTEDAVLTWRTVMTSTIRPRFSDPNATALNAVHGSDSAEAAERELKIIWPE